MTNLKAMHKNQGSFLKAMYKNQGSLYRGKLTLIKKLYSFVEKVYPDFYRQEHNENDIFYLINDIMEEIHK